MRFTICHGGQTLLELSVLEPEPPSQDDRPGYDPHSTLGAHIERAGDCDWAGFGFTRAT